MLFDRSQAVLEAAGTAGSVVSPCISVCRMDASGELCQGCFRTLEEIAGWSRMDDASKLGIWARIQERTTP